MKKIIIAILLILAMLVLISCSGDGDKDSNITPFVPGSSSGEEKNEKSVMRAFYGASTLTIMPGDKYVSLDADEYTVAESGGSFVLYNSFQNIELTLTGSQELEKCVVSAVRCSSPYFAFSGITVGDSASDAEAAFTSFGLEKSSKDGADVYSYGNFSVTLGTNNGDIEYILIKLS